MSEVVPEVVPAAEPAPAPAPAPSPVPTRLNPLPAAAPQPIATLAELTNSHNAISQKENTDRTALGVLSSPVRATVRTALLNWTSRGFPANFPIFSVTVTPPPLCSDGVKRTFAEYVPYLLGCPVSEKLVLLQPLLVGMVISSSTVGNTIRVQVSSS